MAAVKRRASGPADGTGAGYDGFSSGGSDDDTYVAIKAQAKADKKKARKKRRRKTSLDAADMVEVGADEVRDCPPSALGGAVHSLITDSAALTPTSGC